MIPCSWDVVTPTCAGWNDYDQPTRDKALWLASTFLWAATGRRYGVCPITVRPLQRRYGTPLRYQAFPVVPGQDNVNLPGGPFLFAGQWFNAGCDAVCCGAGACAIVLKTPTQAVDEVLVDGEVVPPSAYRVDVASGVTLLVRVDGGCWPRCQNIAADAGEADTFEVTYEVGTPLPEALAIVTGMLACEYAKSLNNQPCALPARMTRLSRQGVEVEVAPADPAEGMTGIKAVDDIITSLNPSKRKAPPIVLSPDLAPCDRYTTVYPGS